MTSPADSPPPAVERVRSAQPWRTAVVVALPALAAVAIAVRLIDLQVIRHNELASRAVSTRTWTETLPARPGDIVDREGRLFATSLAAPSLYVDPRYLEDAKTLATQLATALHLDAPELTRLLNSSRNRRFVWIKRRLSPEEVGRVEDLELPRELAGFRDEFRRHYPQGTLAAHVLGLRDLDNCGRGGLEEAHDANLRGVAGSRVVQRDSRGFVIDVLAAESQPAEPGAAVQTTLDSVVQLHVEATLDRLIATWSPRSATVIVVEPATGEILALASRPAFDPREPGEARDAWKNQAIASVFEPGSTLKPLIVAGALDAGVLSWDDILDCELGAYQMGRRLLHDHHPYGELSVTDVLVKSSNIGMAKVGERLGLERLQALVEQFGFGETTRIGLPGELPGLVRPAADWDGFSLGSIPMGQEIAVTPLQLMAAHQVLANHGRMIPLTLVRSADSNSAHPSVPRVARQIITAGTADWILREALTAVVDRGTGRAAQIEGVRVFGKTGTSQVVDAEAGTYSHERHICSFIGGAPADDPQVLVLVTVEEPHGEGADSGGKVAAPAAREVIEHALTYLSTPERVADRGEPTEASVVRE
jgi:cell division protein FtsI (penicillin-binding protein 3)